MHGPSPPAPAGRLADGARQVCWQAHRGGGAHDAPDNTLGAFRYAWGMGGIPEADLRTTADGVIICLHDQTLARTAQVPADIGAAPVGTLPFAEISRWDVGCNFGQDWNGERVPSLEAVFDAMQGDPARAVYLDIKRVDLGLLARMIDSRGLGPQVLVASSRQAECRALRELGHGVRSMLWIGGNPEAIRGTFRDVAAGGFDGLDQVQLHLLDAPANGAWRYALEPAFLQQALAATRACGVDLEVFPFGFDTAALHALLDMGLRWFATDEPGRFQHDLLAWR